ncbi:uncharacterized protein [Musca autumnalis]|uniref:uncharacterized protein n=1 Tax=Musca autumnalis TaxID=221902 RepID=UPI003CF9230A
MYKVMPNTRSKVCCLCCETCLEWSPNLIGDDGECTDVYEITVKYFDPMVLALENAYEESPIQSNVLCKPCWNHILEFHEFQYKVLEKNNQILKEVKDRLLSTNDKIEAKEIKHELTQHIVPNTVGDLFPAEEGITPLENLANVGDALNRNENFAGEELSIFIKEEEKLEDSVSFDTSVNVDGEYVSFNNDTKSEDSLGWNKSAKEVKTRKTTKKRHEESSCIKATSTSKKKRKQRKKKDKAVKPPKEPTFNRAEKIREMDEFIAKFIPNFECDLCKESFPNYDTLRLHFTKEHQQKCYVICCDKKIRRRYLLVDHLHLHIDPETYKCNLCGAVCNSSRSLQNHKLFMHEAVKDQQVCDQFGKTIIGNVSLKLHKMIMHTEDGKRRKWPCDICNAQLSTNNSLKSHKLSFHSDGTTAFVCKDCGKVAANEKALLRHKKFVHLVEPKYKCTYCEKSFKRNIHLKEHIATHTGESLYQCPHCPQTFKNNANMHKHRKIAHPIEWAKSRENRLVPTKVNSDGIINAILL